MNQKVYHVLYISACIEIGVSHSSSLLMMSPLRDTVLRDHLSSLLMISPLRKSKELPSGCNSYIWAVQGIRGGEGVRGVSVWVQLIYSPVYLAGRGEGVSACFRTS